MASLPLVNEPRVFTPEFTPAARDPRPALRLVAPARAPAPARRLDVDLPPALVRTMALGFAAFVGVMAWSFGAADGMRLLLAICGVCFAGYFGLPWVIARAGPKAGATRTMAGLMRDGIELPDGHCEGREAVGLVLLLPAILVCWAVFVAVMHAMLF